MSHRRVWHFAVYAPSDQIDEVYRRVKEHVELIKAEGIEIDIDSDATCGEAEEVWGVDDMDL